MNSLTSLQTLVLPNLDYCSCVWDPHLKTSTQVEAVQSFAAKLSTKRWSDSFTQQIGLGTIDFQTQKTKTALVSSYFVRELPYFSPHPHPNSQHHTGPLCSDSYFSKFLFCLSVASLWNFLPDSVISVRSLFSFKHLN